MHAISKNLPCLLERQNVVVEKASQQRLVEEKSLIHAGHVLLERLSFVSFWVLICVDFYFEQARKRQNRIIFHLIASFVDVKRKV